MNFLPNCRLSVFNVLAGLTLSIVSFAASANTVQCSSDLSSGASSGLKMSVRMVTDTEITDVVVGRDGNMESLGSLKGQAPPERNSSCGPGLYAYKYGPSETGILICLPNYLVSRGYERFQAMIAFHSMDPKVVECSLSKSDVL